MFLSTQLIMPFRYHVTNVGVRAVTTTMDQGGCILLRHTLLYCRLVTIKPQAKKILFREPYSNSFLYFCYIFAMWQCGQLQKRFLFFMYVHMYVFRWLWIVAMGHSAHVGAVGSFSVDGRRCSVHSEKLPTDGNIGRQWLCSIDRLQVKLVL